MSEPTLNEQIEAANAYEALFVPSLFRQWATTVADVARIRPGERVLDVACGTGILAREAAFRIGPHGRTVGVDANPGMIAVASRLAPAIEWRQAVAESIPLPDESFDAVVSQFGLMFFRDRCQSLREMMRVLIPGGRLVVAVWDSLDQNPAYGLFVELLERTAGSRAADALRAPFGLGDPEALRGLAAEAGLRSSEIQTRRGTADFPTMRAMVEADLRGWLPVVGVLLDDDQIDRILKEAEHVLSRFVVAGRLIFPTSAHLLTATE